MHTREHVLEAIAKVATEKLGCKPEEVIESALFTNDLGADSLDVLDIALELETQLDVSIPNHIFDRVNTVGELADFIIDDIIP